MLLVAFFFSFGIITSEIPLFCNARTTKSFICPASCGVIGCGGMYLEVLRVAVAVGIRIHCAPYWRVLLKIPRAAQLSLVTGASGRRQFENPELFLGQVVSQPAIR
jgi:hypothetical protein